MNVMASKNIELLKNEFSSNEWPSFLALDIESDDSVSSAAISFVVTDNVKWFEGHFPDQPVLAGVVQTHWVGILSEWLFDIRGEFRRIDNLKFQTVILPDTEVIMSLNFDASKNAVKFFLKNGDVVFSEGRLVYSIGE